MRQCFRVISRRLAEESTLRFELGASCAKKRAVSAAVLTKPPAEVIALVGLSPGMTRRLPAGSLRECPRANRVPLAIGTFGSVSRKPAASTISRLIQEE